MDFIIESLPSVNKGLHLLLDAEADFCIVGEARDATAILVIVALNAAVGVFQEYKAERALEALQSLVVPTAQVRRDGRTITVPARELGD